MDIKIAFSILSIVISLFAFFPYIRDVISKKTQPHEFTWLIWTITQATALSALWFGGGGIGGISLLLGTFLTATIFLLSITNRKSDITKSDITVLILALSAIPFWWLLNSPLFAVLLVSAIDLFGYIPTFRKSYHHPWAETLFSWIAFPISNTFAILALENLNALTMTYLIAIASADIALVIFLLLRRKKNPASRST